MFSTKSSGRYVTLPLGQNYRTAPDGICKMSLEAIRWKDNKLEILDQLLLPASTEFMHVKNVEDGWQVINKMQVRGAPAIAIVGCLSLAAELVNSSYSTCSDLMKAVTEKLQYLVTARPTAVNMRKATDDMITFMSQCHGKGMSTEELKSSIISRCENMLAIDVDTNKKIGDFGAQSILANSDAKQVNVITHCNTGSLATAGYGTALGVIRSLHAQGKLGHAYCTETRPYNQGARLTAFELVYESMPSTLICDNMAASLMKSKEIHAVVVGADRVTCNGDTANKIGTYQATVVAKYHGVPFYVCAPITSIDLCLPSGESIPIEERPHKEMTHVAGVRIAAPGISCWNPAFDVTPAELITGGIVTELGVFKPSEMYEKIKGEAS
ncbi:methylthioribose-1-phosphate isomerase isoform X2 [Macrobrachium rosenbergii]|uniref:methylthioribose-1-phosphate isomerase isoform X2 n=1 Tax=Macrobrachium rosenbergii TaxID=79674 RepID=UPI0034D7B0B0